MLLVSIDSEQFQLVRPVSLSRMIKVDEGKSSQAFHLPKISSEPVSIGEFVGDIDQGGSCNVNLLQFTPHNLTHVETPKHVSTKGKSLIDLPRELFSGIALLLDLSMTELGNNYIMPENLQKLENYPHARILIIKTKISNLSPFHDFSDTDPISLHPNTTKWLSENHPSIQLLVLDLPSTDKENDGGKLLAHKNFFNLDTEPSGAIKAIVELAYLPDNFDDGYYYLFSTVPKIDTDAFPIDLILYHLDK